MRGWISRSKEEEGYTLPELMVSVMILSLIVYATFLLMTVHINQGSVITSKADVAEELRETLDTMVNQLRTARIFDAASSESVTFQGYVTGTNELFYVRFRLVGEDMMYYSSTTPPDASATEVLLAPGVTGLEMIFFDSASSQLNDPGGGEPGVPGDSLDSITLVEIELTINASGGGVEHSDTAKTSVSIRK